MVRIIGYFLPASQPTGFMKKPSTSQPSAPLYGDALDRHELQLLPERGVQMRQLLFVPAVQIGDIEIVEVCRIVDGVGEPFVLSLTSTKRTVRSPEVTGAALRAARSTRNRWLVPFTPVSK